MPGPMFDNNAAPSVAPAGNSGGGGESNTLMDSLGAALTAANAQVTAATQQLNRTPMYTSGNALSPTMPVPSLRSRLFAGASPNNPALQRQPQTRAGARSIAIGKLAGSAASVVGAFEQKKEAEKTQALAIDIHKSLELQQGIDEAKAILQQDPNNQDAKQQLQKNTTLLTALLNGKSGKDIAKAYGVTFGDEAKDMSPDKKKDSMHYKAMQDAMKQKGIDQQRMAQFEAGLPSRSQVNPQYEQQFKNLTEIQKQADNLTKTYTTLAGQLATAQSRVDVANINAQSRGEDMKVRAMIADATNQTRAAIEASREDAATKDILLKHQARLGEIGAEGANRMREIQATKGAQLQVEAAKTAYSKTGDEISKLQSEIDKQQKILTLANRNKKEDTAVTANINSMLQQQQILKGQQDSYLMYMFNDPDAAGMLHLTNPSVLEKK